MFHHHMALPPKLPLPQWTGISHQNSNSQSHFSSRSSLASFPLLSILENIFPALSLHLTMTLLCDRAWLHVQTSSLKPLVHVIINVGVNGLITCSTFRVLPHNTYWCDKLWLHQCVFSHALSTKPLFSPHIAGGPSVVIPLALPQSSFI